MALQPFDYTLKGVQDPAASFMTGMKQSVDIRGLQAAREEAKLKQEQAIRAQAQQEAMDVEMAALAQRPTVEGIRSFVMRNPSLSKNYEPILNSMTAEQKANYIKRAGSVYAALKSGRKDLAISQLDTYIEAARNSGKEEEARNLELQKKMLESQETGQAGDNLADMSMGIFLAIADPDNFIKNFEGLGKERRETAEAPAKQAKAQADLAKTQAEVEAGNAPETRVFGDRTKQWDQKTRQWVDIGPAPKGSPLVQVGLGEGQKGFENETTLRKEFNTEAKPFNEVASAYSRLESASKDDTGASDIAMIYSYMKMLDPGSVVREGEFATAENAGGVGEKVRNLYNKVMQGTRLTPAVRADYLKVAGRLNTESKVKFNKLKSRYRGISERAGLKPENVITLEELESGTRPTPSASRTVSVDY